MTPPGQGLGRKQPTIDGEGGNRTRDTTIFSRVLYQLSYLARQQNGHAPACGDKASAPGTQLGSTR